MKIKRLLLTLALAFFLSACGKSNESEQINDNIMETPENECSFNKDKTNPNIMDEKTVLYPSTMFTSDRIWLHVKNGDLDTYSSELNPNNDIFEILAVKDGILTYYHIPTIIGVNEHNDYPALEIFSEMSDEEIIAYVEDRYNAIILPATAYDEIETPQESDGDMVSLIDYLKENIKELSSDEEYGFSKLYALSNIENDILEKKYLYNYKYVNPSIRIHKSGHQEWLDIFGEPVDIPSMLDIISLIINCRNEKSEVDGIGLESELRSYICYPRSDIKDTLINLQINLDFGDYSNVFSYNLGNITYTGLVQSSGSCWITRNRAGEDIVFEMDNNLTNDPSLESIKIAYQNYKKVLQNCLNGNFVYEDAYEDIPYADIDDDEKYFALKDFNNDDIPELMLILGYNIYGNHISEVNVINSKGDFVGRINAHDYVYNRSITKDEGDFGGILDYLSFNGETFDNIGHFIFYTDDFSSFHTEEVYDGKEIVEEFDIKDESTLHVKIMSRSGMGVPCRVLELTKENIDNILHIDDSLSVTTIR